MTGVIATVQAGAPPRVIITATDLGETAVNLLTNPSFETSGGSGTGGAPGWSQVAAQVDWYQDGPAEGETYLLPTDGTRYAFVYLTGSAGTFLYQYVPAPAVGEEVSASIDMAASQIWSTDPTQPIPTIRLTLAAYDSGGNAIGVRTDEAEGAWAWQGLATDTLNVPEGTTQLRVGLSTTATVQGANVCLDNAVLTNITTAAGKMTLYRVVDGVRTKVRGAIDVDASAGVLVVTDNEAPFGVPVFYVIVQTQDSGATIETTSNTVILDGGSVPWLTNPITGEGVALTIQDWPELAYATRQSVLPVAGRMAPVVVSDIRVSPSSDAVLLTRTRGELKQLRTLLSSGDVVLIRPVCEAVEPVYAAIAEVTESRVNPNTAAGDARPAGSDWRRLVTLAVQAVDQPEPAIPAVGDTLEDLAAYVPTTLADMADAFGPGATLLTIAQTALAAG